MNTDQIEDSSPFQPTREAVSNAPSELDPEMPRFLWRSAEGLVTEASRSDVIERRGPQTYCYDVASQSNEYQAGDPSPLQQITIARADAHKEPVPNQRFPSRRSATYAGRENVRLGMSERSEPPLQPATVGSNDSARSAMKAFIKDPQSYKARISGLEKLVFDKGNSFISILSNGQSEPNVGAVWVATLLNSDLKMTDENEHAVCLLLQEILQKNLDVFLGFIKCLEEFVDIGFSGPFYNVICTDPTRDWVLRVVPITMANLFLLSDIVQKGLETLDNFLKSKAQMYSDVQEAMADVGTAATTILNHIGLSIPQTSRGSSPAQMAFSDLQTVSSTACVLFLGLLSFINSHVGVFDVTVMGHKADKIVIAAPDPKFHFNHQDLACLNSFTNGPVWGFSNASSQKLQIAHYLSVSLVDFASLWGPLRLERDNDRSESFVSEIGTSGGSVRKLSSRPSNLLEEVIRPEETLCHWFSWTDTPDLETEPIDVQALSSQRLLIGAPREYSAQPDLNDLIGERTCQCTYQYWNQCDSFHLGTENSYRTLDTTSFQLSFSKFIGGAVTIAAKVNPQITLKDAIITDWLPHPDYSLTYKPEPEYLDYDTVIEISSCAGNFRRTSLWEILRKISRVSQYLHQHDDETHDIQKIIESIAHHETFTSAWAAMKGDQRTTMKLAVRKLLQNLQKTGVVPGGDTMKAWDVGRHNELYRVGRKLAPRWAIIAKDSVNLATFVVMTDTCLKHYSDDRICHTSIRKALPREILRTRLRVTPQSYIYAHPKKSFVLKRKTTH